MLQRWRQKANLKRFNDFEKKKSDKRCKEKFPEWKFLSFSHTAHSSQEIPKRWVRLKVIVMQKLSVFISSKSTRKKIVHKVWDVNKTSNLAFSLCLKAIFIELKIILSKFACWDLSWR